MWYRDSSDYFIVLKASSGFLYIKVTKNVKRISKENVSVQFSSVQSLSRVRLFAIP